MHGSNCRYVKAYVTPRAAHGLISLCLALPLLTVAALGAAVPAAATPDPSLDLAKVLKGVEKRYNAVKTLQVSFEETYKSQGRARTEAGDLFLRKPGRMRWQYSTPAGKLFVCDGKTVFFYSPETKRAEKMKLKETEDMRAPMAFLLGRLDFDKDFGQYRTHAESGGLMIAATPRSEKMPYREVAFLVAADSHIQRLIVTGQDSSVLDFSFSAEKVNPTISGDLFVFQLPPGAEFYDSSETPEGAR
jgi:outer membrane lipoprotein carrier protein